MKNKIIFLITAFIFIAFSSCKKDTSSSITETEPIQAHQAKEFDTSKFDAKIDSLIAQMTLEEKIGMLHGNSMFSTGGVKRLGIPELKMADGPLQ